MYKPPPKLPHWQQESTPVYRRAPLSRRTRLFLIFAITLILWYHYSRRESSEEFQESIIDSKIARSYPAERERLVAQPILLKQDAQFAVQESSQESNPREKPIPASKNQPSEEDEHLSGLALAREMKILDSDPPFKITPAKEVSPEYPDEESLRKQAILDSRKKAHPEQSEIMGEEPPVLVKQASEKLIGQHLSPAAKYDEVVEDKAKASSKLASQNLGNERFSPYSKYAALDEKAEALPDIIHIPFEDSTADVALQGWEDQWYSDAEFDVAKWGNLTETKIDFVYTWVNGSEEAFRETIYPYEVNSTLNDPEGKWLESHRVNRYRDWDELRYSIRSVETYAGTFRNKIQLLVNAVADPKDTANATVENPANIIGKQRPLWLKKDAHTKDVVQVLSQEDFFDETEQGCLPTFNSLTIENQIFNTKSDTDRIFALSDDMLLGKPHAASDIYSPLFGPTMGFKTNSYNTVNPPTDLDARRFGEKPFLIYTSWLLNRRFGERKRKGQIHFGHSISRSVTREAIKSFPRPALQSACQRFRGETGFQLYSWYVTFHYTIERHREALLWSYIMLRSDLDRNGNLNWEERQKVMEDLEEGMTKEGQTGFRKRMFYNMNEALEAVGLEAPKVNVDVQWTSLDGPAAINNIECFEFNVNECLAPGFSTPTSDEHQTNHVFSTASIFDYVSRQHPKCGDCLIKLLLNRAERGLSSLLPHAETQAEEREIVIKALWKYQYSIVDPDAFFVMITDAEQVENVLFKRLIKRKGKVGQLCLNDDVSTEEPEAVENVRQVMIRLLESMVPEPSAFEKIANPAAEEAL